jgi:hypothetical protein
MTEEQGCYIEVEVQPNARKFEIKGVNEWTKRLRINVTENPIKGKANKEIAQEMKALLDAEVLIVKGQKSSQKTLYINKGRTEVYKRLGL